MADTDDTPDKTGEEPGKNTEGKDDGKGTDTSNQDAPKFTQADQNKLAEKIRREEKKKYEEKAAEEKRLAEEAKAKEQGEFQKLAEAKQKELDELKPKHDATIEELETYRSKVAEMVAAELKDLPAEVKDLAPVQLAEDKSITNPLDVLAWLPKGKALAAKLNGEPAKPGTKVDPKPKDAPGTTDRDKRAAQEARRAYRD